MTQGSCPRRRSDKKGSQQLRDTSRIMQSISLVSRPLPYRARLGKIATAGSLSRRKAIRLLYFRRETRTYLSSCRSNLSWRRLTGSLVLKEMPRQKQPLFLSLPRPVSSYPFASTVHARLASGETEINMNFARQKLEAARLDG